jgi:hypothetical protein
MNNFVYNILIVVPYKAVGKVSAQQKTAMSKSTYLFCNTHKDQYGYVIKAIKDDRVSPLSASDKTFSTQN